MKPTSPIAIFATASADVIMMSDELAGVLDPETFVENTLKPTIRYNDADFHVTLSRVCVTQDTTELVFVANYSLAPQQLIFSRLGPVNVTVSGRDITIDACDIIKLTFGRKIIRVKFKSTVTNI